MVNPAIRKTISIFLRAALALGLIVGATAATQALQESQDQAPPQDQAQPQNPSSNQPQDQPTSQAQGSYATQDRSQDQPPPMQQNTPPDSRANSPQQNYPQRPPVNRSMNRNDRPSQAQQDQQYDPGPPPPPPPPTLTIPAGTVVSIRTNDFLSSDHNKAGDIFTATLDQPIVVNGWVVARRGQTITGQVKSAKKAGFIKGQSELGVEVTDLTLVDGNQVHVGSTLWQGEGGTTRGRDAGTIAGTTGTGAAIGAIANAGKGAAIGAGAGAAAGIGAVLLTRGRSTVVPPETQLSFRLNDAVAINTTQSAQAFWPVSQEDYDNGNRGGDRRPARRYVGGYPYAGYYGYYPGYYGFYDGYWGPRYYGGFGYGYGFRGGRGFHRR